MSEITAIAMKPNKVTATGYHGTYLITTTSKEGEIELLTMHTQGDKVTSLRKVFSYIEGEIVGVDWNESGNAAAITAKKLYEFDLLHGRKGDEPSFDRQCRAVAVHVLEKGHAAVAFDDGSERVYDCLSGYTTSDKWSFDTALVHKSDTMLLDKDGGFRFKKSGEKFFCKDWKTSSKLLPFIYNVPLLRPG